MKKNLLFIPILFIFGFMSCKQDVGITYPIQRQILTEDESSSSLAARGFSTDKPIQVSFNSNGKLVITSYAPTLVKDVEIYNGDKLITKIKELAGFSEIILDINKPAELTSLIVKSEDPFMKKVSSIKRPMTVSFGVGNAGPWAPMNGKTCRDASIIAITMSYMFNHEKYLPYLTAWHNGGYVGKEVNWALGNVMPANPFRNDDGTPLAPEKVSEIALNTNRIDFKLIKDSEPAGGIGGANSLGMRSYLYSNFTNFANLPSNGTSQKKLDSYTADVIFHEFGHCMGFMHYGDLKEYKGTMTYGGAWTNVNYRFLKEELIPKKDLPIPLDGKYESRLGYPAKL